MQLGELSHSQIAQNTEKVVVVPLGSLEQHGHHLPLLTDSMIGGEIARRARIQLGETALWLPMLWLGASPHHSAFAGTVTLSNDVYVKVIEELVESLIKSGFRRLFLLNSHAGNVIPANLAIQNVGLRHAPLLPDLWMTFASWFSLAAGAISQIEGLQQGSISHACEWETSQIAAIRPELVGENRPASRFDFGSQFFYADYARPSRVDVARRIEQGTASGAFGWPELASIEKGEALFEAATQEVVAFVREFSTWKTPQI